MGGLTGGLTKTSGSTWDDRPAAKLMFTVTTRTRTRRVGIGAGTKKTKLKRIDQEKVSARIHSQNECLRSVPCSQPPVQHCKMANSDLVIRELTTSVVDSPRHKWKYWSRSLNVVAVLLY